MKQHLPVGAGKAVVAVSDDGPGIPAGEREKVFRRLYRLDKSRTTVGSGLGLSLVRAIADLHAGDVRIRDNRLGVLAEVVLPLEERRAS
jgi:signal transduction histidine kinase